jgi:acetyl-CoA acetyltransferase
MGRLLGSLKGLSASDLGGMAIKGALEKAGVAPEQVDYVIMGEVLRAGEGQMPARQAAVKGGIPMSVPSLLINKVCLSGLDAIALADQLIRVGEFEIIVNATSASLGSEAPSTGRARLVPGGLCYDMMYSVEPTAFLAAAARDGARIADGIGMLVEQAAEAFLVWRGVRPETAPVYRELRRQLDAVQTAAAAAR